MPQDDKSFLFRLAVNHPQMDKHILGSLKRLFLKRNKEILCSKAADAYNSCSNATTVHQFIKSHHTFAGSSSLADYYAENNPIDWIPKVLHNNWSEYPDNTKMLFLQVRTPILFINSEDDIVCLAENIREDIVR